MFTSALRDLQEVTRSIGKPTAEKESRGVIIKPLIGYDIIVSEPTATTRIHGISHAVVDLGLFLAPSILQITLHGTVGHII